MRNPWRNLTVRVSSETERLILRRIRARYSAEQAARAALSDALADAGSVGSTLGNPGEIHGKGKPGDPTGRQGDRIAEARTELERVAAWEAVFLEADAIYPADSDVGKAVHLVYHAGWSQTAAAREITGGNDRQAIRARLAAYLGACYDIAARAGLLKTEGLT